MVSHNCEQYGRVRRDEVKLTAVPRLNFLNKTSRISTEG